MLVSVHSDTLQELVPLKQESAGSDFHLSCSLPVGPYLHPPPRS